MKNLESQLQQNCITWFRLQYKEPYALIFAIPNGGKRSIITATIQKKEGVLSGIPDIAIISNGKIFFIEMKFGKNKLSENQKKIHDILKLNEIKVFTCYSFDEFRNIIKENL